MEKQDLQQIGQLMEDKLAKSEGKLSALIDQKLAKTEARLMGEIDKKINQSEEKTIGKIVESEQRMRGKISESEEKMIGYIGQVLEDNIFPQLQDIHGKISQLPDKGYLDEKISMAMEKSGLKLLQEDEKVDRMAEVLYGKKVLDKKDMCYINKVKVFPNVG